MNTLKVEKRDMKTKAKRLRREGFVTGNIFGKKIEGSIPVKMTAKDADDLFRTCRKGSQLLVDLEGKELDVLIKEMDYDSMKHQILEIDFQELVKGEMVNSVAEVVLLNHDSVKEGIIELDLTEIAYRATPDALVEKVEIDMSKLKLGDEVLVKDLPLASNEKITLQNALDDCVVKIVEPHITIEEEETDEEETETEETVTE